eukprot:CAMPEP_0170497238 /NCGR_PEP_ID=MMETSP0208-20121228/24160_1 /TAXON_ID=197538 /ORGANISM="Strombidium inclinatum, Strain S3" /LENGTH=219 /DNA_ID=CAMNT_0010773995 /DNA_START=805 /DNA_END=1466 /DNA_ORIENTATION=+
MQEIQEARQAKEEAASEDNEEVDAQKRSSPTTTRSPRKLLAQSVLELGSRAVRDQNLEEGPGPFLECPRQELGLKALSVKKEFEVPLPKVNPLEDMYSGSFQNFDSKSSRQEPLKEDPAPQELPPPQEQPVPQKEESPAMVPQQPAETHKQVNENNPLPAHEQEALREEHVLLLLPEVRAQPERMELRPQGAPAVLDGDVPDVLPQRLPQEEEPGKRKI